MLPLGSDQNTSYGRVRLLAAFALKRGSSRAYQVDLPFRLIDLTVFTAPGWALVSSQRVWVLAGIIAVEIFNRGIALILAGLLLVEMLPQYLTVFAFGVCIVRQAVRGFGSKRRAALWFPTLFAAVFVFGDAVEWRVWLIFVPDMILTVAISNDHLTTSDDRVTTPT